MLIRRWRCWLHFPAAMDLDQPLKFMCALAALFYPTFRHCSSWTIPHISARTVCAMHNAALSAWQPVHGRYGAIFYQTNRNQ
jgi:hypothetical protein